MTNRLAAGARIVAPPRGERGLKSFERAGKLGIDESLPLVGSVD